MATISDEDMLEIATLVYRRWAEEFFLLKAVKIEKNDGSDPDWEEMHNARLTNHEMAFAKWDALYKRVCMALPKLT